MARAVRAQTERKQMFADAEAYEKFMGRWSRLLAPLLVDFTGVHDKGLVLDVGSGTGVLAFSLAEKRPQCDVRGIDPSKEYVEFAASRNPFPERVKFDVGDAQQMRFRDATFQSSLSLLVFNFVPDGRKALREVIRVTKPGGVISAAVWDYGDGMRMLRLFWDAVIAVDPAARSLDEAHMPLCREGELRQFWTDGGLRAVHEQALEIEMQFQSFADYWDPFLLGQGPAGARVRGIADDRRTALKRELRARLHLASDDSPFSLPARAWAVRGIRGHAL
jgi:ubiquinone/menaquinone biosynthesis C-methylase UbiE